MNSASWPTILKRASENIARNWLTTVPTMVVMAIVLAMFYGLLMVHAQAQATIRLIEQKFSLTVYLKDGADSLAVGDLINALEERSDIVKPVIYTSKEEAWNKISKDFALDTELLKQYEFSLPASIAITPKLPEDAPRIEAFIQSAGKSVIQDPAAAGSRQKNVTQQMLEFITKVRDTTLKTIVLFIILFVVGGTLLLSSAIHLAIAARHREIGIMKLVGASQATITAPFVLEGIIVGLAAYLIHLPLIYLLPLKSTSGTLHLNTLLLELAAVLLLSGIASYFASRFHIHKKLFR